MVNIPFVGTAYKLNAVQLDAQTCINWYLTQDATGKYDTSLLPRPGLNSFSNINGNQNRGGFELNGVLYCVIDNTFYTIDTNGTGSSLGKLTSSSGPVKMIANGYQIFLTDGENAYVYQYKDSTARRAGTFLILSQMSSVIGVPVFLGTGLNDMSALGSYTGTVNKNYVVVVDSIGTPGVTADTFKWSMDGGLTYVHTNIAINGGLQLLDEGIEVKFGHVTGHSLNDQWTFSVSADANFYVPIIPAYQDTYGIYIRQNSYRFYISAVDDFTSVNALNYASSNSLPDNLVAGISIRGELYLFGQVHTQVFYDTGNPTFPFQNRSNILINYGCAAPYSLVAAHNNMLLFLGKNKDGSYIFVSLMDYNCNIISTEAINAELRSYIKVDDAASQVIEWNGHIFYVTTFPTADRTWVYDINTDSWAEWRSLLYNTFPFELPTRQGRWKGNWHAFFNGMNLVGDFESGKIFKLDDSYFYDDGRAITCERTTQVIYNQNNYITIYALHLDVETGVGLVYDTLENYEDPKVMLQVSRDSGKSWGNELWRTLGKLGHFKTRVRWSGIGTARVFTFRIRISDPVYRVIMGAVADLEVSN